MLQKQLTKIMRLLCLCLAVALFTAFTPLSLQAQTVEVSGKVIDNYNDPLTGASVVVKGTTISVFTDLDGNYKIQAPAGATLVVSFLGFTTKEEPLKGRNRIDIKFLPSEVMIDEVVVVAYGTRKKVTLTGAVASVKGDEMLQTKNENPQNMLTGRIAGVRVWQKSSEPGTYNNNFDIRGLGAPLVIIDGIPRTTDDFQRLNPNDIEDVSVLKDASAAIYGVRAANGVVLVTTRKGAKDNEVRTSYTGSLTLQQPSGFPLLADAFETMTLYNERTMNNANGGGYITFSDADFEAYRNGTKRVTDWNALLFSDLTPQTQHNLSITGGNDRTQYYIGMGYLYQEGIFKSGDLNYGKYNLRSNISTQLFKGLTFDINLNGVADERNTPYSNATDIIRNYWRQGVLYPAYADPEQTMLNYEGLDLEENTVAKMTSDISGYRKYKQKYFQSAASLNYDFGEVLPVLKGLSAKALFSFDYRTDDNTIFRKEYYQYAYNPLTGAYDQKLYNESSPSQLRRETYSKQQTLGQLMLSYDRSFGEHKLNSVVVWETQKRDGDNFYAQRDLAFPMEYLFAGVEENQISGMSTDSKNIYELANMALAGRVNYSYADRYLAEVQFRYDGSSKFAPGYQWGFFPSASVGWRLSEEPFFKQISALSFIKQLKFRASYGVLGDDNASTYQWATGYTYPAVGAGDLLKGYYNGYAPGYMVDGKFVTAAVAKGIANEAITWFTSHTLDLGVDFEAWKGLFGFSFDYFDRRREGLLVRRSGDVPTVVGSTLPEENLNSDRHFGIELELSHKNKINDFIYKVKAIGTITRNQYLTAIEKGPYGNSYDYWRNNNLSDRYQGVQFGYEGAGRFENWQDIWSYPIYHERDALPGDYKYVDWNGDGEISGLDEHPYAYDQTPWLNFSFNFDGAYKNFDLSILFQGSALGSMEYKEPLYNIWGSNGGGTLKQYLDRWHPVDPLADPYDLSTQWVNGYYGYTGHYPRANSDFNRVSTAYLRLKSVELGYTLPKIKSMQQLDLRVFANAYNLFTITGVKFVDPEHPDEDLGRLYPLNKTYTLGLTLSF